MLFILPGCGPTDPRRELFSKDEDLLGATSITEEGADSDSLAIELKTIFDETINPELKPREFSYLTRISEDGERLLVLIQMPSLKKWNKPFSS